MPLTRFSRVTEPPPLQIQRRDLDVLLRIHEFTLLTREQIQRLEFSPSTASACKRRLTLLYHNGYVGRLPLPIRNAYGAARAIYFLERAGEQALAHAGLIEERSERFRRPEAPGELFLHHRMDIADVRVAFTVAARLHGHALNWWDEAALRSRSAFRATGSGAHAAALLPDGYFTLGNGAAMDGFAVEVDRATVPEERMRRRYIAYGELAATGAYRGSLPCDSLRVLTIVTDGDATRRLGRLKRLCESVGGRSLFWFADRERLNAADVLEAEAWFVAGEDHGRTLPLSFC